MKKVVLILSTVLLLASCGSRSTSGQESSSASSSGSSTQQSQSESSQSASSGSSTSEDLPDPSGIVYHEVAKAAGLDVKDGPILHAWGWTLSNVKSNLNNIAQAGFKNIQLSPLQPSKGGYAWWTIYQPLGFKVAANAGESPFGTKQDLKSLTAEADKYGINIIMDVVTNHLAGENDNNVDGRVQQYEPTIYNNQGTMIHHNGQVEDWFNREQVATRAMGGYPDVVTANKSVQDSIIGMLKDYIDCGVKGFRFDAAKSIETDEDDARYKSDYWPYVTGKINEYGLQKNGAKPFIYGEILNETPQIPWTAYTKYMSINDNKQGRSILEAVNNHNTSDAASTHLNIPGLDKAVLWAESHDTYANKNAGDNSFYITDTKILNLAYAIQTARKDATSLYFVRPQNPNGHNDEPAVITPSSHYRSSLVRAVNKLHTDFVGGSEEVRTSGSSVVNIRKTAKNEGALIANVNFESSATVDLGGLSDGQYTNIINNTKVTVSNHKAQITFTEGGCVLEKDTTSPSSTDKSPTLYYGSTAEEGIFTTSIAYVGLKAENATSSYYQINGGEKINFSGATTFDVGRGVTEGTFTIAMSATNSDGTSTYSFSISKQDKSILEHDVILRNAPNNETITAWVWKDGGNGVWKSLTAAGSTLYYDLASGEDFNKIIFVKFPNGTTDFDWSKKTGQTGDLDISTKIFDYNSLAFQ